MLSRVADSLFWMSRYLERAENAARLVDVHLNFMLEASETSSQQRLRELQQSLSTEIMEDCTANECLRLLTFSDSNTASVIYNITQARQNARNVREEISSEMWTQINKLYLFMMDKHNPDEWDDTPHDLLLEVRERSHLFQGVTDATMMHNQGWHFIQLGRAIERSLNLLQLLRVQFVDMSLETHVTEHTRTDQYFELVTTLKSVTAFEAYCKVYNPNPQARRIVSFLLFDRQFPRSLRFSVEKIQHSLDVLHETTRRGHRTRLPRVVGRLASTLNYDEISDVQALDDYLNNIQRQINAIHNMLYDSYITYPIESELPG